MDNSEVKFDLGFLNKISGGDINFIKEMIKTFKELAPEYVENSTRYIKEKNYEALSREAHKFLPGVSFLGIKFLEEDLVLLEEYTKKETNLDKVEGLFESTIVKISEIIDLFDKEFDLD